MGNWLVCENSHDGGYREFEMVYQEHFETLAKRFVRVWDDGRIEVGVRNSPFEARWGEQVVQDQTNLMRNMRMLREGLQGK